MARERVETAPENAPLAAVRGAIHDSAMAHVLDLLAEVEGALTDGPALSLRPVASAQNNSSVGVPPRVHAPSGHNRRVSGKSEVDELLSMIDDDEPSRGAPTALHRVSSTSDARGSRSSDADLRGGGGGAAASGCGNKCASVYLGGAASEMGQARATTRRCEAHSYTCPFAVLYSSRLVQSLF